MFRKRERGCRTVGGITSPFSVCFNTVVSGFTQGIQKGILTPLLSFVFEDFSNRLSRYRIRNHDEGEGTKRIR